MSAVPAVDTASAGRVPDERVTDAGGDAERQLRVRESAFLFECAGESLPAVLAAPVEGSAATGVLVVVGGPQYRVGSHRQFVQLSRRLAESGVPCMRFDYRGMGDASGLMRDFEAVSEDLRAAVDAFFSSQPQLERVVLWGLCDGASAACLYAPTDARVAGLVLLNPWVRTPEGAARTQLRHYYFKRILEPSFWRKLFGGGVALGRSLGGLVGAVRAARVRSHDPAPAAHAIQDLPTRMASALAASAAEYVFFLSERDYVAREFEGGVAKSSRWCRLLEGPRFLGIRRFEADHTFSTKRAKEDVAVATLAMVMEIARRGGRMEK